MTSVDTIELGDADFDSEVLESKVPVLVDFWGTGCQPCKVLAPIIDELARENRGRAVIGKVNTDANIQSAVKYGIQMLPTLLVFKNGTVVNKLIGLKTKKEIQAAIDAASK